MKHFSDTLLNQMMDGNQEEIANIAKMFIKLAPQMIADIDEAINNNEWRMAGDAAHKIKSSINLLQIEKALPLALFIEINGRKEINIEEIKKSFKKLVMVLTLAIDEMKLQYL